MKYARPAATSRAWWMALIATFLASTLALSPNITLAQDGSGDADRVSLPEPIAVSAPAQPLTMHPASTDNVESADADPVATQAERVVMLVNQFRAQNGLPPLKSEPTLTKSGQDYAVRQGNANFFGHNDPDFGCNSMTDRDTAAGYTHWSYMGENLAAGYSSSEAAFIAWTKSDGHRANMLNPNYRETGAGYADDVNDAANVRQGVACPYTGTGGPYRYYWSQEFGSRFVNGLPHLPVIINGEAVTTTQRTVTLYVYGGTPQTTWAKQMRFSNDGSTWSSYEAWTATRAYTLPAGTGIKTIYAQLTDGNDTQTVSDTIYLIDGGTATPTPSPTALPGPTPTPSPTPKAGPARLPAKIFIPIIRR